MEITEQRTLAVLSKFNLEGPVPDQSKPHYLNLGPCWEWTMATNKAGYGIVGINRKSMLSHRASWIIANGPIPEGMDVLHKCDNRKCGNPAHLFLGNDLDNMRDRDSKGRNNQARGDKNGSRTMPFGGVISLTR